MSQHFLLSAKARTLSLSAVLRMTDQEAETAFVRIRWAGSDGKPVCPRCECPTVYDCRKSNGAPRWRCKACRKDFSVTSGTLFAFHKMPLRNYLAASRSSATKEGQERARALSGSGRAIQNRVRSSAQATRGDGVGNEGPHDGGPGRIA